MNLFQVTKASGDSVQSQEQLTNEKVALEAQVRMWSSCVKVVLELLVLELLVLY